MIFSRQIRSIRNYKWFGFSRQTPQTRGAPCILWNIRMLRMPHGSKHWIMWELVILFFYLFYFLKLACIPHIADSLADILISLKWHDSWSLYLFSPARNPRTALRYMLSDRTALGQLWTFHTNSLRSFSVSIIFSCIFGSLCLHLEGKWRRTSFCLQRLEHSIHIIQTPILVKFTVCGQFRIWLIYELIEQTVSESWQAACWVKSAYILHRVKLNHRTLTEGQSPWSIRQTAVYHRFTFNPVSFSSPFDFSSFPPKRPKSIFLLISPSHAFENEVSKSLKAGKSDECEIAPCIVHQLLVANSLSSWLDYMAWLEEQWRDQVGVTTGLDN